MSVPFYPFLVLARVACAPPSLSPSLLSILVGGGARPVLCHPVTTNARPFRMSAHTYNTYASTMSLFRFSPLSSPSLSSSTIDSSRVFSSHPHLNSLLQKPIYGKATAKFTVASLRYGRSLRLVYMAKRRSVSFWVCSVLGSGGGELGNESEDDDVEGESEVADEAEDGAEESDRSFCFPEQWDVLGLGQAMVDFSGVVDGEFLERLGLEKGTRKVVNHEERGRVLRAMDGCSYKAAAGGSLSNTLVALARLGCRSIGGPPLNVAMAGSVGSDPLGSFYRAKLRRANVNFLSAPIKDGTTGTVIVLTTPDAQRTMLAYQGTSSAVNYDACLARQIPKTRILVVEGYLFELPDTIETITKACEDAHRSGALVAVTASDVSCIERHYDDFLEIVGNYADIIFANCDEARAFCHFSSEESPVSATRYLSHFVPFVSVTDGHKGSYIGVKGEAVYIPPSSCVPVDACGAGDAYASGILYGILRGTSDIKAMGSLAARIAATVVGQQGTRLRVQAAVALAESFALRHNHSNVNSDQISSL